MDESRHALFVSYLGLAIGLLGLLIQLGLGVVAAISLVAFCVGFTARPYANTIGRVLRRENHEGDGSMKSTRTGTIPPPR